jgi:DNA (cytosine-5)-methyltransferase 1
VKELSLFTGAGGGLLGTHLLGWTPIGYVEFNDYCQRVLKARIEDGYIPDAPIFGDIKAFISEGYAESYQGMVDVVTAGFPCQPWSNAGAISGARKGAESGRNMWPETCSVLRVVQPRLALLENVPALISSGYFQRILAELAEIGYGVRWEIVSAATVGAPHIRKRLWVLADADGSRLQGRRKTRAYFENVGDEHPWHRFGQCGQTRFPSFNWSNQPYMGGGVYGVASRVDRLKALGNGQVPAVVRAAWELLTQGDQ